MIQRRGRVDGGGEKKSTGVATSPHYSPMGQIMKPELESGLVGRCIISSGGTAKSASGLMGIFGPPPPICLTRTRPLPMAYALRIFGTDGRPGARFAGRCYRGPIRRWTWS
jgi:hypothetical protein